MQANSPWPFNQNTADIMYNHKKCGVKINKNAIVFANNKVG